DVQILQSRVERDLARVDIGLSRDDRKYGLLHIVTHGRFSRSSLCSGAYRRMGLIATRPQDNSRRLVAAIIYHWTLPLLTRFGVVAAAYSRPRRSIATNGANAAWSRSRANSIV